MEPYKITIKQQRDFPGQLTILQIQIELKASEDGPHILSVRYRKLIKSIDLPYAYRLICESISIGDIEYAGGIETGWTGFIVLQSEDNWNFIDVPEEFRDEIKRALLNCFDGLTERLLFMKQINKIL